MKEKHPYFAFFTVSLTHRLLETIQLQAPAALPSWRPWKQADSGGRLRSRGWRGLEAHPGPSARLPPPRQLRPGQARGPGDSACPLAVPCTKPDPQGWRLISVCELCCPVACALWECRPASRRVLGASVRAQVEGTGQPPSSARAGPRHRPTRLRLAPEPTRRSALRPLQPRLWPEHEGSPRPVLLGTPFRSVRLQGQPLASSGRAAPAALGWTRPRSLPRGTKGGLSPRLPGSASPTGVSLPSGDQPPLWQSASPLPLSPGLQACLRPATARAEGTHPTEQRGLNKSLPHPPSSITSELSWSSCTLDFKTNFCFASGFGSG